MTLTVFGQDGGESKLSHKNVPAKTLGGRQFWTDVEHLDGWRIQKNHVIKNFRLLDAKNVRRARGDLQHCEKQLAEFAETNQLKPYSGKVVVLLHGLGRSHISMEPMAEYLQGVGYETLNFQYASGRASVGEHALVLQTIVDQLGEPVTEINFVAHSLGNIVIRCYLKNTRDLTTGLEGDPRIRSMVMLGPPNRGSQMAKLLNGNPMFRSVTGTVGLQLGKGWPDLEPKLATPKFPFGIIAGGQDDKSVLNNPVLNGQDDLVVSIDETRLNGAHDFHISPIAHTFMMSKPSTMQMAVSFLKNGYFVSAEQRQPVGEENLPADFNPHE